MGPVTDETTDIPPEGMELVGVALAGGSERGATTWGLNLVFTAAGIRVRHPQSQAESLLAWSGLDAARCAERLVLPDGRNATVLELISDGLSLRFLLPSDTVAPGQAAYLDKVLPEWLARCESAPVVVPAPVTPAPVPPIVESTAVPSDTVAATGLLDGELTSAGEAEERPAAKGRHTRVLPVVLLALVVIAAAVYVVKKHDDSVRPAASAAAVRAASALAASINVRASDLPAGWGPTTAAALSPPAALPDARIKAAQALAACVQQPSSLVDGWFGTTAFAGQIAAVTSRTFQSGSAPAVQIFSITKVMRSPAQARSLAAPLVAQTFATCFGQYQVAAVAVPITAQVESVALSAPAGVEAYCYETTFTLANREAEVVEDAFIVGGRTATVLQPSAAGLSVPSVDLTWAYDSVARRVAQAGR